MKKSIFFLIFACFFCLFSLIVFFFGRISHLRTECVSVTSDLSQNSTKNNDSLIEEELRHVFSKCFGYTLIGEKPISIEYCCASEFNSDSGQIKKFISFLEKLFDGSSRFLLKTFNYEDFYSEIILIDTSSLSRLINNDRYLLSFIKKHYGTIEGFFRSVRDPQLHIFDCFRRDNVAIGISLGYGGENSRYYQRYLDVGFYLKKYPLVCCLPFDPKPMPDMVNRWALTRRLVDDIPYKPFVPKACSKTFVSLENEWHWMRKVMNKDRDETEVPYFFQLPFFISKKGVETDELRKKYCKARDRLAKKFYGRKFSEVIAEEAFRK